MCRRYELEITADVAEASRARSRTREQLLAWGLDGLVDPAELLVDELVTNAITHTGAPARLLLAYDDTLLIEIIDTCPCPPQPRSVAVDDTGGWGLQIVEALTDNWGWHPSEGGKTVWCRISVPVNAAS